jgi:hypothetical protein
MTHSTSLLSAFFIACCAPVRLDACGAEPPEVRVQSTAGGEVFLRVLNSKRSVEVRRARDLQLLWKSAIADFDPLFSEFKATPDGKFLVHVKGNHMVSSLNQSCIDVYGRSGFRDSYRVNEIRKSLPKYRPKLRFSTDPKYVWHEEVKDPSDQTLIIRLDEKRYAWLSLGMHKVEIYP